MNILIVDDSRTMRTIVTRTLAEAGFARHTLSEAHSGKTALAVIQNIKVDLILCDWNMPEMSGLELLETLNSQEIEVDFGFVTTEATPERRRAALRAGAMFLITKPFTAETFQRVLTPFLARATADS